MELLEALKVGEVINALLDGGCVSEARSENKIVLKASVMVLCDIKEGKLISFLKITDEMLLELQQIKDWEPGV